MSEEEIIRNVKRILEYKVISNYINNNDSRAIQGLLDLYYKQQKEIEHLNLCLESEDKAKAGLENDIKSLLNIEPNNNFVHKDKIKEVINKFILELEKEKEYRYTGNVENEQEMLREVQKELLKE